MGFNPSPSRLHGKYDLQTWKMTSIHAPIYGDFVKKDNISLRNALSKSCRHDTNEFLTKVVLTLSCTVGWYKSDLHTKLCSHRWDDGRRWCCRASWGRRRTRQGQGSLSGPSPGGPGTATHREYIERGPRTCLLSSLLVQTPLTAVCPPTGNMKRPTHMFTVVFTG